MARMGTVENGYKKRTKKRRNPTKAAKSSAKNPARRSVSLARAKAIVKANGLKAVSATANPRKKHKRRRRNGLNATPVRRNGFFGNTKNDVKQVASIGAGAIGVKAIGKALSGMVSPILSQIGVGAYAEIITNTGLALFVAPYVGQKLGGSDVAKHVRLGGLLAVGLDLVNMFAPSALSFNPFNTSPIVVTGQGAAVTPAAVAQLAKDVADSPNPQLAAAQLAGVMHSLDNAGIEYADGSAYAGGSPELVM